MQRVLSYLLGTISLPEQIQGETSNYFLTFLFLLTLFTYYYRVDGDSSKPFDLLGTKDGSDGKKSILLLFLNE